MSRGRDVEAELFESVRGFVRKHYSSRRPKHVIIVLDDGERVRLPIPHHFEARPAAPEGERDCASDILTTLGEVGHRMTTSELFTALEQRERIWGESTTRLPLAEMVREGQLTNDPQARPHRGYGLPDWE